MKLKIQYLTAFLFILYFILLIKTAWICDDAFITYRTIDNFINGYGLRWNVIERVQSYTHPLWLFLLSGFYFFTHEIYFTGVFLSIIISLIVVFLLTFKVSKSPENSIFLLLVILSSKAFIDYSTSGLENPLTHLLLVFYVIIYLKEDNSFSKLFRLSFIASLIAVNRMDSLLIIMPSLFYNVYCIRKIKTIFIIGLGFLPFISWEIFSLLYYGFPFPNTAFAKLNTGVSNIELFEQGIKYYINSLIFDPVTIPVVLIGCLIPVLFKKKILIPFSIGIALYLIYVIRIGGDFMNGRFFTTVLLMALIIISLSQIKSLLTIALSSLTIIVAGFISPYPSLLSDINYGTDRPTLESLTKDGIADERACYYRSTGLLRVIKNKPIDKPVHFEGLIGKLTGENNDDRFAIRHTIGFFGYYAGPGIHILDVLALSDPLLARLSSKKPWRIGHFERYIPKGYCNSIINKKNVLKDKSLSRYYGKLCLINRDEIFTLKRLKEILKFNLGYNDSLLKAYYRNKENNEYDQIKDYSISFQVKINFEEK